MKHSIQKSANSSRNTSQSGNENSNNIHGGSHPSVPNHFGHRYIKASPDEGIEEPEKLLKTKDSDIIQWVALTKVLDRFFFFLFLLIIALADIGFLVLYRASAP